MTNPYYPIFRTHLPLAAATVGVLWAAGQPPVQEAMPRMLTSGFVAGIAAKAIADEEEDSRKSAENAESAEIKAEVERSITQANARCEAAYYQRFPHHYGAIDVPDWWRDLWAETAGQPHLALQKGDIFRLSPSAQQPVSFAAPISQVQAEPVIRHEMGVRGGSFDRGDDDYDEPAPMMQAPMMQAQAPMVQPMTMMAQPPIAMASPASRFLRQSEPVNADPIATKYGKTIASITDMHSPHSKPRHLAFLAVTQCGKTTTLGAVSYALKERYPDAAFVALDGKNSEWAPFYMATVYPGLLSTYDPHAVIQFLKDAGDELEDRVSRKAKNESRLFVILDEWNSVRDELKAFNSDMCAEADLIVNALVLRGLEYGIHVIIVCQEVNCGKLGFTDAGRGNVHFLALGRSGDKTMVDLLLSGEQILKAKLQREQLQQDFLSVWSDPNRPQMSPVLVDSRAYTAEALPNFSGMIQLVKNESTPPPGRTPIAPAQPAPPRSPKQPMLQLMPQGGIMDDRPTATSLMLPEVTHYQQSIDGATLTLTDPALLDLLTSGRSPYLPVIVRQAQKGTSQAAEGTTTVREIQSKAPHNKALQSPNGTPFTADIIRRAMAFLAESYPRSFVFDGQTLTIIDPALIEADI